MDFREELEAQIEQVRLSMYQANKIDNNHENVIEISQELDGLLNQLDNVEIK